MHRAPLRSPLSASASLLTGLLVAQAGCGAADDPGSSTAMQQQAVTRDYHQDAKAVLDRYCVGCHQSGGIAPFALGDYQSAKSQAALISSAVDSGRMPPWLPLEDSLPLRYSRRLRPEDKQVLLDWVKDGALEGDPAARSRVEVPPADVPAPPRVDLKLKMEVGYQPNKQLSDDYRCFVIDPGQGGSSGLPADSYMQAASIIPGQPAIVHHVIVFEVPASKVADVRKKDSDEDGPGYTCFGGAGVNNVQMVMGWAPGGTVTRLDPNDGVLLRKGSVFVMQVHYNLVNFHDQTDATTAEMELAAAPPANQVVLVPLANPSGLKIPAGNADASQVIPVPVSYLVQGLKLPGPDLTIVSNAPHMHLLGTRISTSLDSQPLVDIGRWDFHWQQSYVFEQPVIAHQNQLLFVECHYDNSAANQPVINGMPQKPHDVSWGEGTFDEMCLSFIGVRFPRPAQPPSLIPWPTL